MTLIATSPPRHFAGLAESTTAAGTDWALGIEARAQLRTAHDTLGAMGMGAFAERIGRELQATGEAVRKRSVPAADQQLTAQEAQVGWMARDGLSNPETGARLFISVRTVQYHLHKVFTKLAVESRGQLGRVLPERSADLVR
jgi:DNA-binding CsgD family transcriptional regulator